MDNNENMNNQQENWAAVLNEFDDHTQPQQPEQAQQNAQFVQPDAQYTQPNAQYAQQGAQYAQPNAQYAQPNAQYAQPNAQYAQPNAQYAQPNAQYAQPNAQYAQPNAQFAQAGGQQFAPQGMPAYDAGNFAVMPPKQKSKVLPIILIILAAAIVVGGLIFAYFTFFKSNASYEQLERQYFANIGAQMETITGPSKSGSELELRFTPGSALAKQLYTDKLADTVIRCKSFADTDSGKAYVDATYLSGEESIIGMKMWSDETNLYIQIPELSDVYLKMNLEDLMSQYSSLQTDMQNYLGSRSVLTSDSLISQSYTSSLQSALADIDPAVVEKIFNIFADTYFEVYKDVKPESASFTSGDITVNCSATTISFTQKNLADLAVKFLDKISGESDIMSFLAASGLDSATISAAKSYLEEYVKGLSDEELNKEIGKMVVYTKDNNIIGRVISVQGVEITIAEILDGGKFAFEISASQNGTEAFKVLANGTVHSDKYDGTASATADGKEIFTAEYSLTCKGTDTINGNIKFNVKAEEQSFTIDTAIDCTANNGTVSMNCVVNSEEMFTIAVTIKELAYEDVTIPEVNESNSVDISSGNTDTAAAEKFQQDAMANVQNILSNITSSSSPDIISYLFTVIGAGYADVPQQDANFI